MAFGLRAKAAVIGGGAAALSLVPAKNAIDYKRERKAAESTDFQATARRLNRTKAPKSYPRLGFKSGDDVSGVYLSKNPKVMARNAHGLKTVRSEPRNLRHTAEWWSASDKNVEHTRSQPKLKPHYSPVEVLSGKAKADVRAHTMNRLVANAPRNAPTLYRGGAMSERQVRRLKEGRTIKNGTSSWTSDPKVSRYFSQRAASKGKDIPVTYKLERRSQSVQVAPATRRKLAEWVSSGKYEVTGMNDSGGNVVVRVRQKRKP